MVNYRQVSVRVARIAAPDEALGEPDYDPDRPPTGPGSPMGRGVRTDRVASSNRPRVVRLNQPDE
jgi:hypothetical protein